MLSVAQASQAGMAILGAINVVYLQEPNMWLQLAREKPSLSMYYVLSTEL